MRPTKYLPEMIEAVRDYTAGGYKEHEHVLPTIEGLSKVLQVSVSTVKNWANDEDKQDFLAALDELKDAQRQELFERGLLGEYNSTIAKLMLSHNHGVVERSAKEHSGPNGRPLQIQEVRRTIVDPEHTDS